MVTWSASKEEQSMIRERKNEKKRGEKWGKRGKIGPKCNVLPSKYVVGRGHKNQIVLHRPAGRIYVPLYILSTPNPDSIYISTGSDRQEN